MASMAGSSIGIKSLPQAHLQPWVSTKRYCVKPSASFLRTSALTFQSTPLCLRFACPAKPETVEKVSDIVKQQLALTEGTSVTSESKFSELGADSLDTVEIVMSLEQEFGVSVEEDSAQKITTIGEAAELIEKLQN